MVRPVRCNASCLWYHATMINPLDSTFDFSALSLKDLIEARDLYHVHLMHRKNVIATAVGKYLIRPTDPRPGIEPTEEQRKLHTLPRRLEESEVREYSWPCILVFVKEWWQPTDFQGKTAQEIVPKALYMPDGR